MHIRASQNRSPEADKYMIIGHPKYIREYSGHQLGLLPGAETEAKQIADLLRNELPAIPDSIAEMLIQDDQPTIPSTDAGSTQGAELPFVPWTSSSLDGEIPLSGDHLLIDQSLSGSQAEPLSQFEDKNVILLTGAKATLAVVEGMMPSSRIVHIATHGIQDNRETGWNLKGFLALAVDPKSDDPVYQAGLLSAEAISRLHLQSTEMVVLSSCNTALGGGAEHASIEGVLGLTRAFIMAGAPAVVSAMWKVDDKATTLLMTHFYTIYRDFPNYSKAKVLQQAMLKMVNGPDKEFHRPRLWAAFICTGFATA